MSLTKSRSPTLNVRKLIDHSLSVTHVRSRAPLRLGLAGGGTDVSPYADTYGGCVLNATINMFAQTSIRVRDDGRVKFSATDLCEEYEFAAGVDAPADCPLVLHRAVYRRIVKQFLGGAPLPVTVTTASDAPSGSGLGSSSTLVVSMIDAYRELLALPLGEYDIAQLAYEIERIDAGQAGGKQDQYAAAFGGINFLEFGAGSAIVNPLRIRNATLHELESMLVLYFTGISRQSSKIIAQQAAALRRDHEDNLAAMHGIRENAIAMKNALLRNELIEMAEIMASSWEAKKRSAAGITNDEIDRVYEVAKSAGAYSGKVSGAGGGGFMFFMVDPLRRPAVIKALSKEPGLVATTSFCAKGSHAWRA